MKKIVICGGHLTPALSLIKELKKNKELKILFFGRKFATSGSKNLSAEFRTISKEKINFYQINAGKLQRSFTIHTIPEFLKIPIGFIQALLFLLIVRPNAIISFGGYLSLPIVFSGWLLGIKSITHEQSTKVGLANKINSLFVEKIYLSWPQSLKYLPSEKTELIGNLTRRDIFSKKAKDLSIRNFLKKSKNLILIVGGNQGSHFINKRVFTILPKLSDYSIFHQVGTANYDGDLDKAKRIKLSNYFSTDYVDSENIGAVLNRADLVIARSGANTVWDLAMLKKVSILIPLPFSAAKEQEENARILKANNSAVILEQKNTSPERLLTQIRQSFKNLPKQKTQASKFQKTLSKDASIKLANYILSYT